MALERQGVKGLKCQGEGSGLCPLDGLGKVPTPTLIRADPYKFGLCFIYEVEAGVIRVWFVKKDVASTNVFKSHSY